MVQVRPGARRANPAIPASPLVESGRRWRRIVPALQFAAGGILRGEGDTCSYV